MSFFAEILLQNLAAGAVTSQSSTYDHIVETSLDPGLATGEPSLCFLNTSLTQ